MTSSISCPAVIFRLQRGTRVDLVTQAGQVSRLLFDRSIELGRVPALKGVDRDELHHGGSGKAGKVDAGTGLKVGRKLSIERLTLSVLVGSAVVDVVVDAAVLSLLSSATVGAATPAKRAAAKPVLQDDASDFSFF
jgi:hypothetical protein